MARQRHLRVATTLASALGAPTGAPLEEIHLTDTYSWVVGRYDGYLALIVEDEIVHVISAGSDGAHWWVARGREGTTAAAHDVGASVVHGPTIADFGYPGDPPFWSVCAVGATAHATTAVEVTGVLVDTLPSLPRVSNLTGWWTDEGFEVKQLVGPLTDSCTIFIDAFGDLLPLGVEAEMRLLYGRSATSGATMALGGESLAATGLTVALAEDPDVYTWSDWVPVPGDSGWLMPVEFYVPSGQTGYFACLVAQVRAVGASVEPVDGAVAVGSGHFVFDEGMWRGTALGGQTVIPNRTAFLSLGGTATVNTGLDEVDGYDLLADMSFVPLPRFPVVFERIHGTRLYSGGPSGLYRVAGSFTVTGGNATIALYEDRSREVVRVDLPAGPVTKTVEFSFMSSFVSDLSLHCLSGTTPASAEYTYDVTPILLGPHVTKQDRYCATDLSASSPAAGQIQVNWSWSYPNDPDFSADVTVFLADDDSGALIDSDETLTWADESTAFTGLDPGSYVVLLYRNGRFGAPAWGFVTVT